MRTELKKFRVGQHLTQAEMATKTGVSRPTYRLIENGERSGSHAFWSTLQRVFNIADEDMFKLMKLEEKR